MATGKITPVKTLSGDVDKNGSGTTDHTRLKNRELPDQHPIESITGLTEAIAAQDQKIEETAELAEHMADGVKELIEKYGKETYYGLQKEVAQRKEEDQKLETEIQANKTYTDTEITKLDKKVQQDIAPKLAALEERTDTKFAEVETEIKDLEQTITEDVDVKLQNLSTQITGRVLPEIQTLNESLGIEESRAQAAEADIASRIITKIEDITHTTKNVSSKAMGYYPATEWKETTVYYKWGYTANHKRTRGIWRFRVDANGMSNIKNPENKDAGWLFFFDNIKYYYYTKTGRKVNRTRVGTAFETASGQPTKFFGLVWGDRWVDGWSDGYFWDNRINPAGWSCDSVIYIEDDFEILDTSTEFAYLLRTAADKLSDDLTATYYDTDYVPVGRISKEAFDEMSGSLFVYYETDARAQADVKYKLAKYYNLYKTFYEQIIDTLGNITYSPVKVDKDSWVPNKYYELASDTRFVFKSAKGQTFNPTIQYYHKTIGLNDKNAGTYVIMDGSDVSELLYKTPSSFSPWTYWGTGGSPYYPSKIVGYVQAKDDDPTYKAYGWKDTFTWPSNVYAIGYIGLSNYWADDTHTSVRGTVSMEFRYDTSSGWNTLLSGDHTNGKIRVYEHYIGVPDETPGTLMTLLNKCAKKVNNAVLGIDFSSMQDMATAQGYESIEEMIADPAAVYEKVVIDGQAFGDGTDYYFLVAEDIDYVTHDVDRISVTQDKTILRSSVGEDMLTIADNQVYLKDQALLSRYNTEKGQHVKLDLQDNAEMVYDDPILTAEFRIPYSTRHGWCSFVSFETGTKPATVNIVNNSVYPISYIMQGSTMELSDIDFTDNTQYNFVFLANGRKVEVYIQEIQLS